ncbi:MAG: hypothetical protein JNM56_10990 [Planctomycetia bacterium]|nr:hypothetical protein [Planctomycetia bacterium]
MKLTCTCFPWCVRALSLAVLLGFVSMLPAQQAQEPAPIFVAARAAAANKSVNKSKLLGFSISDRPFDELPAQGAVLVGFEVGLEKDSDNVAAVRPIYRTALGETYFKEYGLFTNRGSGKSVINTRVGRTVRVSASSGYAVSSITVRTGFGINGLSLRYMRIDGAKLDKNQTYASNWVGSERGGEHTIGDGTPIIGVFGNENDSNLIALGVYNLKSAPIPTPPPVKPTTPAPTAKKPPVETKPETVRPTTPTTKQEAAESPATVSTGLPPDADEDQAQMPAWMLIALLAMVLLPGIVGMMVIFGRKATVATKSADDEAEADKSPFDLDELRGLAGLAPLPSPEGIRGKPAGPKPTAQPEAPRDSTERP